MAEYFLGYTTYSFSNEERCKDDYDILAYRMNSKAFSHLDPPTAKIGANAAMKKESWQFPPPEAQRSGAQENSATSPEQEH